MAATLTYEQVQEMRRAYMEGETQGALARRYRMSVTQVARIVRGESWAKVPQPRAAPSDEEEKAALGRLMKLQEEVLKEKEVEVPKASKGPEGVDLYLLPPEERKKALDGIPPNPLEEA